MSKAATTKTARKPAKAEGACVCGAVRFEIDVPAVWAWHDHGAATRHAHGAAYATYVGTWRSRLRLTDGADALTRYENAATRTARSFCTICGTPVFYERPRAPKMVNIPRALFASRTGREPRYHLNLPEAADWEYRGEPLRPLKGFPGVQWERPRRKKPRTPGGML